MPLPLALQAIPWITSGIGSLFSLFGGGKDKERTTDDSVADVQKLLAAFPQLRESMDMQLRQQRRSEPVHQAAMQLALNLAPRSAFTRAHHVQDPSVPANERPDLSQPQFGGPAAPVAPAGPTAMRRRRPLNQE